METTTDPSSSAPSATSLGTTDGSRWCVFCERIARDECDSVGRGCVSFVPLNPVTLGHRLFVPRAHVTDAADEPWITAQVMECAADYAAARNVDCNLITSVGPLATQTIMHLHVHYVPRREDDGLTLPWTGQKRGES